MPEIITPRLCLAPYQFPIKELVRIQLGWLNDPEVVKYSENRHIKPHHKNCEKHINSFDHQKNLLWAILEKKVKRHPMEPWDAHYIGHISAYRDLNNKTADVSIMIGERLFWGQGLGTEAWKGICDWLFQATDCRKIEAGTMRANEGMVSILERTGMQLEGMRKAHFLLNGEPTDLVQYARFRS